MLTALPKGSFRSVKNSNYCDEIYQNRLIIIDYEYLFNKKIAEDFLAKEIKVPFLWRYSFHFYLFLNA